VLTKSFARVEWPKTLQQDLDILSLLNTEPLQVSLIFGNELILYVIEVETVAIAVAFTFA